MKLKKIHNSNELKIYVADKSMSLKIPYFEGGVSAGFPSPAEDYMDGKLDLNNLNEFGKLSKNPVLINTSFNLNRQPNVNTPEDAISTFYASGIDYLIIGDRILIKNND